MTYVKINDALYPADTIIGKINDKEWDGRHSKSIKLEMSAADALKIWTEGVSWSTVSVETVSEMVMDDAGNPILNEEGNPIYREIEQLTEYDNSDFSVAGDITDHRDGTITVKMGKLTELEEALELLLA